jgi:Methyltransferase domain
MFKRTCLGPDLLDQLPAEDPRAIRSRRDIKRINAVMLQRAVMARAIVRHLNDVKPRSLLDLGTGDGTFLLSVVRRLSPRWSGVHAVLLDRVNIVSDATREAFNSLGWSIEVVAEDVFSYLQRRRHSLDDVVTANLFIHHFPDEHLKRLLHLVAQSCNAFVACEPRRCLRGVIGTRMLWAIGCSRLSIHDSIIGVRAGFVDREITSAWPQAGYWFLDEYASGPYSHCFAARRKP